MSKTDRALVLPAIDCHAPMYHPAPNDFEGETAELVGWLATPDPARQGSVDLLLEAERDRSVRVANLKLSWSHTLDGTIW